MIPDRSASNIGGDDLKLKRWDIRAPMMPALVNKQSVKEVFTAVACVSQSCLRFEDSKVA
jgi:hypothetical protein